MRIIHLTPGSGDNFYCENCLRDYALVGALRAAGHDVLMVPLYLPLSAEGVEGPGDTPIFFSGINVYLQQKSALFRRLPRWMDGPLASPALLRPLARRAGATEARDLGDMTLSMLRGEEGRQVKELDRLVDFLRGQGRPDVIVISNALLAGLGRRLREALAAPVVCWLQDEDGFLDGLPGPLSTEAWRTLADRAADLAAFVATSRYYADAMIGRLGLARERVAVVPAGIDPTGYSPPDSAPDPPAVGFLSRLSTGKGLDTLAEAFIELKRDPALKRLRLHLTGGKTAYDDHVLADVQGRLAAEGMASDMEHFVAFDRESRQRFLRGLTALSVPTRQGEACGLYAVEALAAGVPLVLPRHGAFPEFIEDTGGGVLFEPNSPAALAEAMRGLLLDPARRGELAARGRRAVLSRYTAAESARRFVEICERIA